MEERDREPLEIARDVLRDPRCNDWQKSIARSVLEDAAAGKPPSLPSFMVHENWLRHD